MASSWRWCWGEGADIVFGEYRREIGTGLVLGLEKSSRISPDAFSRSCPPTRSPNLISRLSLSSLYRFSWAGGSWNGKVIGIFTSVASARQDLIPFKSSRLKWAFFFCLVSNITFNTDAQTEAPLRWSKAREAPLTSSMLVEACLCWVERHLIFPLKMFYKW